MRISTHTIIKNPETQGYPYLESIESVAKWTNELVIIDGGTTDQSLEKIKELMASYPKVEFFIKEVEFPEEFGWERIPLSMNEGLDACTGDWAVRFDTDYIYHERDNEKIRDRLEKQMYTGNVVLNLDKKQVIIWDKYYSKAKCPYIIRKGKDIPIVKYGIADNDRANDLMFPVFVDGYKDNGLPYGSSLFAMNERISNLGIDFYNYDFGFMTKEQIIYLRYRFERAWQLYFKGKEAAETLTREGTWEMFEVMIGHRLGREMQPLPLEEHPKLIQDRIKNLTPEQFAYNAFGMGKK